MKKNHRHEHKQMAALGLPDFETPEDCGRRQQAMIGRLKRHHAAEDLEDLIEDLSNCTAERCGRVHCSDGCHFGARSLRLRLVPKAVERLKAHPGPVFSVTIVHPAWSWPHNTPFETQTTVEAPRWLKERFKMLKANRFAAFGGWELCLNKEISGNNSWIWHVHFVVSGLSSIDIALSFRLQDTAIIPRYGKPIQIKKATNLGRQSAYCFKRFAEQRVAYTDSQGRQNRRHLPLSGRDLSYFDLALLSMTKRRYFIVG